MQPKLAALAVLAVFGLSFGAVAQDTVKLEYKLQAGTELIYRTTGLLKVSAPSQNVEMTGEPTGTVRFVIADVDATGVMLIGQLPDMTIALKGKSLEGEQNRNEQFRAVSVCRMDRSGNPMERKFKDEKVSASEAKFMLAQLDQRQLDVVALPAGVVAVGASWDGVTSSASGSMPVPMQAKVASTLAEIKTVDGRKCALIKSKLTPGNMTFPGMPRMEITGDAETLFDVDGGFSRSVTTRMNVKMEMGANGGMYSMDTVVSLDSMKTLPAGETALEAKVIKALDAAIASAYDGEYDKAGEALEALKPADLPDAWKAGINGAISSIKRFARISGRTTDAVNGEGQGELPPAEKLFMEASKARQEQKWAEAVAKFKEMAEKFPDNPMAPSALVRAADLQQNKLNDKKSADETRQAYNALMQKRLETAQAKDSDPVQLYRIGAAFAEGGESDKAIDAYRKFLAVDSAKAPANLRLMAQQRVAGLLERQGRIAEAVEAYKAVAAMPSDDDYSKKLQEQAAKKAEALSANLPK